MNYWHIQLHPSDQETITTEVVKKILNENKIIGMGDSWENDRGQPDKFKHEMQLGDIVMIRSGGPLALVKVIGNCLHNSNSDIWFSIKRDVKILSMEGKSFKNKFNSNTEFNWTDGLYLPTTLESANNSRFVKYWYYTIINTKRMNDLKTILNYKKQIILQGPPGTGKTFTAKKLAEKFVGKSKGINTIEKIEIFFKTFKIDDKIKHQRQNIETLNDEFLKKFPKENIKNLNLEDYALGHDDLDNFCYWIEYKLIDTGKYSGRATKGKIYWDAANEEYLKNGFIKDIEDDNEAMHKVAELLDKIITEQIEEYPIGNGFVLKILNTYYPDKYFPINSELCLNNFLKLINQFENDLSFIEKNKKVQEFFTDMKSKFNADVTNYEFMYFLFENFNLKGKVVVENEQYISVGESQLIQFHPSYNYEDFVRGIAVNTTNTGSIKYSTENKIIADFALKAKVNRSSNYVLIIDEINRANLPSVLGELIYALEYRGETVNSMYSIDEETSLTIPSNLYIIGTMNTADRSVGHMDYAIRRRFAFVEMLPDRAVITNEIAKDLFKEVENLFVEIKDGKQVRSKFLASDFEFKDVQIGHSYFMLKQESDLSASEELQMRLDYEIKPILYEYVKDGILVDGAREKIDNLKIG